MSNTYTWNFPTVDVATSTVEGLPQVIKVVHWRLAATDGVKTTEIYGTVSMGDPAPNSFTPFANLTKETVQAWVEASLGADELAKKKAALDAELARLSNPPIVATQLPFGA